MPFSRNIFLIDDDEDDREIFKEALVDTQINVELFTAINGKEGLNKLEETETLPDVIFLDLNMPIMGGKLFLKAIKMTDRLKQIPVYIYSTSSQPEEKEDTALLGAAGFLTKPRDINSLITSLTEILSTYYNYPKTENQ